MSILDIDFTKFEILLAKDYFTKLEILLAKDYPYGESFYKPVLLMDKGELKIGLVSKQSGELLGIKIDMKDVLYEN